MNDFAATTMTNLERADNASLQKFGEQLRSRGYTEARISKRLQVTHPATIELPSYPVYQERLAQSPDDLSTLISLFLLQFEVLHEAANAALDANVVDHLLTLGVLRHASTDTVAANVSA